MRMSKKLKVGDRVRILDGSKIPDYCGGWVKSMDKEIGRFGTITSFCENGKGCKLGGKKINSDWTYDIRGLELDETIVIYRKNNNVIALDKSTGAKGVAHCNPEDTFDFKVGAKLAFDRLVGRVGEPFEEVDETRNAEVGDYIKIVSAWLAYQYENGNILKVEEVYDKGLVTKTDKTTQFIHKSEYVVLENYKPKEDTKKSEESSEEESSNNKLSESIDKTFEALCDLFLLSMLKGNK